MERDWVLKHIPRAKKDHRLPVALSRVEVRQLFSVTTNLKHKTILMTIYGGGLRLSEAANLSLQNIDSKNMQIRIRHGKGDCARYTILSEKREYWRAYHPSCWLFTGSFPDKPIHPRSIQRIFDEAKEKAGIKKSASVHSLRHSFATHLLEEDVNIRSIQHYMGHANINRSPLNIGIIGIIGKNY